MALIEVDVKLVCSKCGEELEADLRGQVDPCETCLNDACDDGYEEGREKGYAEAEENLSNN